MTRRVRPVVRRAFTLVELFIVVSILAIAVALGVPTFSAMVSGANRTLAENGLREAVAQARFLANAFGEDSAAVFVFEPGGSVRVIPMVRVGTFEEPPVDPFSGAGVAAPGGPPPIGPTPGSSGLFSGPPQGAPRDVFAPVDDASGFTLPRGWMVRGYVPAGGMAPANPSVNSDPEWYDSELYGGNDPLHPAKLEGNWVAPEDGYFNPFSAGGGIDAFDGGTSTPRQTFMVRFAAGTGIVRLDAAPAVAVVPRPSARNPVTVDDRGLRIDLADDLSSWARQVIDADVGKFTGGTSVDETLATQRKSQLLGVYSNETVLAGPVSRLALYRSADLAAALGSRDVNGVTGSLYQPPQKLEALEAFSEPTVQIPIEMDVGPQRTTGGTAYAEGVLSPWNNALSELRISINMWIEGDSNERFDPNGGGWDPPNLIGDGDSDDEFDRGPDAVFIIDALSGELVFARGGPDTQENRQ